MAQMKKFPETAAHHQMTCNKIFRVADIARIILICRFKQDSES